MKFIPRKVSLILCFLFLNLIVALPESLKIVTYNTWYGLDGHGLLKMGEYENAETRERRLEILIDGLKKLDADVIFLQEVNPVGRVTGKITRALGYKAISKIYNGGIKIFGLGIPVNLNMGLVILAKKDLNLKGIGSKQISGPAGLYNPIITFHLAEARFVQAGSITVGERKVLLFNTHTHAAIPKDERMFKTVDLWLKDGKITEKEAEKIKKEILKDWARREKEISEIGKYVKSVSKGKPFILAGDFNTTIDADEMGAMVKELKLTDTFLAVNPHKPGYTWDSIRNPNTKNDASLTYVDGEEKKGVSLLSAMYDQSPRRIDFILIGGGLGEENVVNSHLIFNQPVDGLFASDHFGVFSEINLK